MKKIHILMFYALICSALVFASGTSENKGSAEADYPVNAIQFIVPFPLGGSTGTIAQSFVRFLDKEYSVDVVLNSVTGSGGSVGARQVLNSKADGYNFLIAVPGFAVQRVLQNLDFTFRDFEVVAAFASSEQVLVVKKDSPYNSFSELIADAKANPGKVKFGAPMGTSLFMGVLAMQQELGVKFNIIDIGGVSVKAPELMSGRVDAYFDSTAKTIPYINSNEFKAIGVWGPERSEFLPDVQILKESGFNTLLEEVIGVWAPKGTPQKAIDSMNAAIKKICEDAAFKEEMKKIYTKVSYKNTADYKLFLENYEADVRKNATFIK
ncbi:tripartite tricarboxylate transporter substrate binding protein [Treponema parvum]|uniref:Tripartite tricarboxylate transporter substrate binding protein n=1 Tax=Treponema parvum TaxID=138851 RepID=A0A975F189_9SPIR|nr:tripartite tricarboxylate transporter substrate binding protein [Treponema parvum]QTQ12619.1 tripartite tricarboxylate transporter substrate binding protein [Treponema parvum]